MRRRNFLGIILSGLFFPFSVIKRKNYLEYIRVDRICYDFNGHPKYKELRKSITERGIINPIVVMAKPGGFYEVLDGQARVVACVSLGIKTIPAHIIDKKELYKRLYGHSYRKDC